jgi:hypothetical protein
MNKDTVSFGRIRVAAKKVTHFETPPYGNGMELSALFWRLKCGPRTIWSYTLKMKKGSEWIEDIIKVISRRFPEATSLDIVGKSHKTVVQRLEGTRSYPTTMSRKSSRRPLNRQTDT